MASYFLTLRLVNIFQEVPKTPDFAPSRTFYLYTVNQLPTARMLLQNCYKVKGLNGLNVKLQCWAVTAAACFSLLPVLTFLTVLVQFLA